MAAFTHTTWAILLALLLPVSGQSQEPGSCADYIEALIRQPTDDGTLRALDFTSATLGALPGGKAFGQRVGKDQFFATMFAVALNERCQRDPALPAEDVIIETYTAPVAQKGQ